MKTLTILCALTVCTRTIEAADPPDATSFSIDAENSYNFNRDYWVKRVWRDASNGVTSVNVYVSETETPKHSLVIEQQNGENSLLCTTNRRGYASMMNHLITRSIRRYFQEIGRMVPGLEHLTKRESVLFLMVNDRGDADVIVKFTEKGYGQSTEHVFVTNENITWHVRQRELPLMDDLTMRIEHNVAHMLGLGHASPGNRAPSVMFAAYKDNRLARGSATGADIRAMSMIYSGAIKRVDKTDKTNRGNERDEHDNDDNDRRRGDERNGRVTSTPRTATEKRKPHTSHTSSASDASDNGKDKDGTYLSHLSPREALWRNLLFYGLY